MQMNEVQARTKLKEIPPGLLYTAATEHPSSQAWVFCNATIELNDDIASPARRCRASDAKYHSSMSLGSKSSCQASGV